MNMLEGLLGGGKQRSDWDDFVGRYDQGAPYDGISDDEAVRRYDQVAGQLSPQQYEQAARGAFERMSPQERLEFGRSLQQQSRQRGMDIPDFNGDGIDDRLQDSGYLAQATSRMQQRQPGGLGALLGGGGGISGMLGGGGGGGMGGMLGNPLAKAALAGVAAMAVKQMMNRR
jgi:hypothetical protein